jgi:integrase
MAYAFRRPNSKTPHYTGIYLDPDGVKRSAGTFRTKRDALVAAHREEEKVRVGRWHDAKKGEISFRAYVESAWLPSRHIESSTHAGYLSYLHTHFYPFFGQRQMGQILPSDIQAWVTKTARDGLSAASIRKYHMMLHSVFRRAVRDRIITFNPCEETELPKVITKRPRTLTPEEYQALSQAMPEAHRVMIHTAIETGLRWGELIALRPRHLDFLRRTLTVAETIVEVPKRAAPDGVRMSLKPYPKDNEPRTMGLRPELVEALAAHIAHHQIGPDELMFATRDGTPISRNTFRTRVWTPARSRPPGSGSTSVSTTSAMRTPPGCSPADRTWRPSWPGWATPRSRPPRSTSTPCPTATNATSRPSLASPDPSPDTQRNDASAVLRG